MSYYLDTDIIVAYLFKSDKRNKLVAQWLYDKICEGRNFYVSPLVLTELYNVICRKIMGGDFKLAPEPIALVLNRLKPEEYCRAVIPLIIKYLENNLRVKVRDPVDLYQIVKSEELGINVIKLYAKATELVNITGLPSKDLFHLIYALRLAETSGVKYFATLDTDHFEGKQRVLRELGLELEIPRFGE